MRVLRCLVVAVGLAGATTGCMETMDGGISFGGYELPGNNFGVYQFQPPPQVITQYVPQYVPVPTAAPQPQWGERRRNRDRDDDDDRRERRGRRNR